MSDLICIDKVLLFILLIGFGIFYVYNIKYILDGKKDNNLPNNNPVRKPKQKKVIMNNNNELWHQNNEREVLNHDVRVASDPFTVPIRRDSLYSIPSVIDPRFARSINIPTNYYYDAPSVVGYVTSRKNTLIKYQLYGYKDPYNRYLTNYYAFDTQTSIKFDITLPKNSFELFDHDEVIIDGHAYIVTLYSNDYFKYNPSLY